MPMILRKVDDGVSKPCSFSGMQKIVQRMRKAIGLPAEFTLDTCRHVGDRVEEAELTEGQGRASLLTGPKKVTRGMQSEPRRACYRLLGSVTRTRLRTRWQQAFRMRQVTVFRMRMPRTPKVPERLRV